MGALPRKNFKMYPPNSRALEEGGLGFGIQISNRPGIQDSDSKQGGIQDSNGIQISRLFSGIHISKWLGFRIQTSNRWDSEFKLPYFLQ